MPAPLGKHPKIPGAHRPWASCGEQDPFLRGRITRETEEMRAEREACLNCKLPDCLPYSNGCPVQLDPYHKEPGKPRRKRVVMEPPENFLYYGRVETLAQLAVRYGVSKTTVGRWRARMGINLSP